MRIATLTSLSFAAIFTVCGLSNAAEAPRNPTYSADIAPLLNANCVDCHHAGGMGPTRFSSPAATTSRFVA